MWTSRGSSPCLFTSNCDILVEFMSIQKLTMGRSKVGNTATSGAHETANISTISQLLTNKSVIQDLSAAHFG